MIPHEPIRKLNKRLIYWCLLGFIALSIPALISIASSGKTHQAIAENHYNPHPNNFAHDAIAISGTEKFPKSYGDVKQFEEDMASEKAKEENLLGALARLDKKTSDFEKSHEPQAPSPIYHKYNDEPWQEASKREIKQRAFDYYDARRSDIMFIDNTRVTNKKEVSGDDAMIQMMNKSLLLAEKSLAQDGQNPHDMLLLSNGEGQQKDFLRDGKNNAGVMKDPAPFMISEGTLIPAILLSEINTDLPGPILARVSFNIWDSKTGQTLLIPQNSKLVGEYNSSVGYGQNRAQIVWKRIIYPNQQSVELGQMVGVDKKGTSGSNGIVDNHYDRVALALFLTTTLSAGVRMVQGKYDNRSAGFSDELGNSLAQESARIGSRLTDKMLASKPTITVPMGERLNVFVEQDLHLRPYNG